MTSQNFTTHLFIIPLAFAFTIHVIASRYYLHETRFFTEILKNREQINALMLKDKNFENFLPDFIEGIDKPNKDIYRFSSMSIPLFSATGTVKNTKESLIFLNMGKSYMVNIFIFLSFLDEFWD